MLDMSDDGNKWLVFFLGLMVMVVAIVWINIHAPEGPDMRSVIGADQMTVLANQCNALQFESDRRGCIDQLTKKFVAR